MINRRAFTLGLTGCACHALSGCVTTTYQTTGPTSDQVARGYRPAPTTDEGGVWLTSDKEERELRNASLRVRDPGVNALVSDVICRLVGDYCPDLRTYVVRNPMFQATCSPNGMVQVYTGMLLRCGSESQMAAVLGHEFGHYLRRHTMQRIRDDRAWRDWSQVVSLWSASADMEKLRRMVLQARKMAFSRDNERESDEIGFNLLVRAGYDPHAASAVWKRIIEEEKAGDIEEKFDVFSSTHPLSEERAETLAEMASKVAARGDYPDRLADAIAPIRGMLMADEINVGHFKQTETVFNRLVTAGRDVGEVLYYKGELYRRRGKDGDEAIALGFYHEACETAGAPPEAFRSVGVMRWRKGEKEAAREYFRRYLTLKPQAGDREMINTYLTGA